MWWLLLIFSTFALAEVEDVKPCRQNCTMVGNATKDQCVYYSNNEDWLPTAYVKSASCACRGAPGLFDAGWASASAACVRSHLLQSHKTVNDTLRAEMKQMKQKYCNDLACDLRYLIWIEEVWIPLAYKVHVDAYENCCCNNPPAPLWSWQALMLNYKGFAGCKAIVTAIELFGKCGCQGW